MDRTTDSFPPAVSVSQQNDEISLAELWQLARSIIVVVREQHRKAFLPIISGFLIGLFLVISASPRYAAEVRLLPYNATAGGIPSGVAGLAGLQIPVGSGGNVIPNSLLPEISKSLDFRLRLARSPLRFSDIDSAVSIEQFFASRNRSSATKMVRSYAKNLIRKDSPSSLSETKPPLGGAEAPSNVGESRDSSPSAIRVRPVASREQAAATVAGSLVSVIPEPKTGLIRVRAEMPDPLAAADLASVAANLLTSTVIRFEVQKIDEQLSYVESQAHKATVRYEEAQKALAYFVDRNRMLLSATAQIERTRLEREAELAFGIQQQFVMERERLRSERQQASPIFAIVDAPVIPTATANTSPFIVVSSWLALGVLAGFVRILFLLFSGRSSSNPRPL